MKPLRRIPRVMFLLLLFPVFIAPQLFGQNKPVESTPQAPTIKVRTGLVLIPAVVTDAKGNRAAELKKEDFAVFENGKRQEIALFEHVATKGEVMKPAEVPEGVFTNTVERGPDRVTIFVLDLLNSRREEQKEARKQLLEFLSKSLDEREPLCLITVDARGAWLIHGFTSDPKVLVEALSKVKEEKSEQDRPAKNPEEELYKTLEGWHSKDAERAVAGEEARLRMLRSEIGFQDASAEERIRLTLMSLMEIADAFAGIPGRKSMIWATAGFPFEVNDASAFAKGGAQESFGNAGMLTLYEQTWRTLEAANIAVYPLDVSGLINPAYASAGMGEPLPQHVHVDMNVTNLENFADMTGGRFCDRSLDARKCFEVAASDSSDYYLLGIYDKSGTEKPGWRKLSVRPLREGMHVRARSGYYLGAGAREADTDAQLMEKALFSSFEYTGLAVNVRMLRTEAGNKPGMRKVNFEYSIPAGAVHVNEEGESQMKMEFGAAARDSTGKMAGSFSKILGGRLSEPQAKQVREKGILFHGTMELAPGEYELSFAVMDQVNEHTGSVTAPLKVE
ncbi:MAG TPA: VWA domain-containing protein [Candidatus Acidoferrum sp.]|nr:VWA domain-containing protein [Candidatus Acidoferrum sp.]